VIFDIDVNGIVHVTAKDLASNNVQDIVIKGTGALSEGDIDKMMKEADEHAEDDKKKRDFAETRNQANTLIFTVEKSMRDHGDKLDPGKIKEVEKEIKKLQKVLDKDDADQEDIKESTEKLSKISQDLFAAMYDEAARQYAEQQQPGDEQDIDLGPEDEPPKKSRKKKGKKGKKKVDDETVVDVEYEDVD